MSGAQGLRDHANYKGETECLLIHKVIMQKASQMKACETFPVLEREGE